MAKLSIVIPAYNEEKRIGETLKRNLNYLKSKRYDFEVIVVNDGSSDKTSEIVKRFKNVRLISYDTNQGKGHAVKVGVLNANGDYILFCDADLSTSMEEVEKLLRFIKEYDVIIASRAVKGSQVKSKAHRKFLGRVFAFLVNILAVPRVKDTQCGFKLFKKRAAREIFSRQKIKGWAFDVETLFLARKLGYKIKEIGVRWQHFDHKDVGPTWHSFRMLVEVLAIRLNYILGKYK